MIGKRNRLTALNAKETLSADLDDWNKKLVIQDEEYIIPYHYQDLFAPAQSIERSSIFETILSFLNVSKESIILDIGCGDGRFCYFAKNYCTIDGIDVSERALSWAKVFNPELKFYCSILQNYNFDKIYDGLVCIEVLEHIPDPQIDSFLKKCKEIIKPEGKLIITVPSINIPLMRKHFRHYDQNDLTKTLSKYFSIKIIGQSRMAKFHRNIMSLLNIISLLFYSENVRDKFPKFVSLIAKVKKKYWYKYLHTDLPDRCYRLIAVCSVKDTKS